MLASVTCLAMYCIDKLVLLRLLASPAAVRPDLDGEVCLAISGSRHSLALHVFSPDVLRVGTVRVLVGTLAPPGYGRSRRNCNLELHLDTAYEIQ